LDLLVVLHGSFSFFAGRREDLLISHSSKMIHALFGSAQ